MRGRFQTKMRTRLMTQARREEMGPTSPIRPGFDHRQRGTNFVQRDQDTTVSGYCDSPASPKTDSSEHASSSDSGVATDECARPRQRRRHGDVYYWNKSKYRHSESSRSAAIRTATDLMQNVATAMLRPVRHGRPE